MRHRPARAMQELMASRMLRPITTEDGTITTWHPAGGAGDGDNADNASADPGGTGPLVGQDDPGLANRLLLWLAGQAWLFPRQCDRWQRLCL